MINCLHPHIILNNSRHVSRVHAAWNNWIIVLRGNHSMCVPPPKKAKITREDLDSCYYLNPSSGEMIPIYIEVPCQKCIICKDNKAKQWATRITCEGNYHINCPWWITLTYNLFNIDSAGLNKKHLQNFFKRLRERIFRQINEDVRVRFVAVGEYGGNTARPHYHAQIFGLPNLSAKETLTLIENAWSHRISRERYNEIVTICAEKRLKVEDYVFFRYDKNRKPLCYLRYGYAYVKPAHDNTPLYLAKYMFKPELNTPFGCTPNFCLSSRKNGIGYEYIQEYMDYHRRNPEVTQIVFNNKHTGKLCRFGIPQYFKDYWFPTPSKIIPVEVRQSYVKIQDIYSRLLGITTELLKYHVDELYDDTDSMVSRLNEKYFFYKPIFKVKSDVSDLKFSEDMYSNTDWMELFRYHYLDLYTDFYKEYCYLMSFEFDARWLDDLFTKRDRFRGACTQQMLNRPQSTPEQQAYVLAKYYQRLKDKDLY